MNRDEEADDSAGALRLSLTVCMLVVLAYVFTASRVGENIQSIAVIGCFVSLAVGVTHRSNSVFFAVVSLALLCGVASRPLDVPNHHWMLTYLTAGMALCLWSSSNAERQLQSLSSLARWLLVVLMLFATIQKAFSSEFMDGSYIGFELCRGGFGSPLLKLFPGIYETIELNISQVQQLHATPPTELESVELIAPLQPLKVLALAITYSILVVEAWLTISMLLLPKNLVTHISYVVFAISLATFRQEVTFISVVCTMGLLSCGAGHPRIRWLYATSALVFAALVLKTLNQ